MKEYTILDLKLTGKKIKSLRLEKGLTVGDVAKHLGNITEQSVYKWQRGECLPTVDNLCALSRLFNTTIDDILVCSEGKDDSPSLF